MLIYMSVIYTVAILAPTYLVSRKIRMFCGLINDRSCLCWHRRQRKQKQSKNIYVSNLLDIQKVNIDNFQVGQRFANDNEELSKNELEILQEFQRYSIHTSSKRAACPYGAIGDTLNRNNAITRSWQRASYGII